MVARGVTPTAQQVRNIVRSYKNQPLFNKSRSATLVPRGLTPTAQQVKKTLEGL